MTKHWTRSGNIVKFGHCLITLPKKTKKIFGTTNHLCKQRNIPNTKCISCSQRVCTYCLCSPGVYHCPECFGYHLACCQEQSFNTTRLNSAAKKKRGDINDHQYSSRPKNIFSVTTFYIYSFY